MILITGINRGLCGDIGINVHAIQNYMTGESDHAIGE